MNVRTKLILSYALVITLCLALAGAVSAALLRNYQLNQTRQRLADIAEPVAVILHENINPATFDAGALLTKEASQTQTRMILVQAPPRDVVAVRQGRPLLGVVIQDTGDGFTPGATIRLPEPVYQGWLNTLAQARRGGTLPPASGNDVPPVNAQIALPQPWEGSVELGDGRRVALAAVPLRAERGTAGFRVLIVAEPAGAPAPPFGRLVMPLLWAALSAFLVSILLALVLARSITRPLVRLTAATRAVAGGDYAERVPVQGEDEVGELATSFNAMAAEIERAHRRERDVLANISHDLKTPLTSIQGFAGALVDGTCPPDSYPDVARIIEEEAQRMGRLVGDILQLSRLESGDFPLSPEPIDLAEFLNAGARRFAAKAAEGGVELRVTAPDAPAVFRADRARLEQALDNLVDNALRYTPRGGHIDLVGEVARGGPAPAARLLVRDSGAGIDPADLPRIFERFYQADKSRAGGGRRGSSGLGLAIVKELVERHGGTIYADSAPGAGTTMTIALPLGESDSRVVGLSGSTKTADGRRQTADGSTDRAAANRRI
ncbi:MAG TPA: HAMP domain-containing sensor histidine kinase [Thermomicrobiales bacterium]|nr:HAMP domain-containing sensor histidine kinase [Thermomicrobiales bacterium]